MSDYYARFNDALNQLLELQIIKQRHFYILQDNLLHAQENLITIAQKHETISIEMIKDIKQWVNSFYPDLKISSKNLINTEQALIKKKSSQNYQDDQKQIQKLNSIFLQDQDDPEVFISDIILNTYTNQENQFLERQFEVIEEYYRQVEFIHLNSIRKTFEEYFDIPIYLKSQEPQDFLAQYIDDDLKKLIIWKIPDSKYIFYFQVPIKIYVSIQSKLSIFQRLVIHNQNKIAHFVSYYLERFSFYRHYMNHSKVILFHFNKDGYLMSASNALSQEMMQKYDIKLTCDQSKLHFEYIFGETEILQHAQKAFNLGQDQEDFYSFCNDENPKFELMSQISINRKFKGFYIYLTEEFEKRTAFQITRIMQDKQTSVQTKKRGSLLDFDFSEKGNNSQKIKQQLMNDPENYLLYAMEYLPVKDQMKMEKKISLHFNLKKIILQSQKESQDKSPQIFQNFLRKSQQSFELIEDDQQTDQVEKVLNQINSQQEIDILKKELKKYKLQQKETVSKLEVNQLQIVENFELNVNNFKFDIFQYAENQKLLIAYSIFQKSDLISQYNIPLTILCDFLWIVRKKYNWETSNKPINPFHNFNHGITVMQGCFQIATKTRAQKYLSSLNTLSLIFAGLCHDIKHTSRTNAFEINSQSRLATRYHDSSPLEQHHAAVTFRLLKKKEYNIMQNLDKQTWITFRKQVISNILSTDMKEHFQSIKKFEQEVLISQQQNSLDENQVQQLTGLIIHSCDFTGNIQEFELSQKWSQLVNKEFSSQYNEENKKGITVTPYLKDLDKPNIMAKNEIGFIKMIVLPLYDTLNRFLQNDLSWHMNNLQDNIKEWEKILEISNKQLEQQKLQQQLQENNSNSSSQQN